MNSIRCLAALLALLPICLLPAQAQGQKKPDPITRVQQPMIKSVSIHNPTPSYLVEEGEKSNDANQCAEAFLKAGDADAAIATFQEALSFSPQNSTAYLGLAHAHEAKGQWDQAVQNYRLLFYHWPGKTGGSSEETNSTSLMRFALALLKTGQRTEALQVYMQGIHYLPTDRGPLPPLFTSTDFAPADFQASAYTAIGLHELAGGISDDAPGYFDQAIAIQPSLATAYYYRGEIFKFKPGRAADAIAAFKQAAQLGGPEMKPFLEKARQGGTAEFTTAAKR